MYKKYITIFLNWLLNALKLQLFLNIISLVILIHWGLPVSILSPIGNLVFAPFLIIFLTLSSLVFFTELLYISNAWIANILESFTNCWIKLLSLGNDNWKIYLAQPPFYISILLIMLSILAVKHKKIQHVITRIICLILIFIFLIMYNKMNIPNKSFEVLKYRNAKLYVISNNSKITLQDKGLLEKANWQWIQYDLITHLIKKFGHCNVEKLVVKNINKQNEKSIKLISKKCNIKDIKETRDKPNE